MSSLVAAAAATLTWPGNMGTWQVLAEPRDAARQGLRGVRRLLASLSSYMVSTFLL